MPFSLSLYLYTLFQEKFRKEFEKKNTILDPKDIEKLLADSDLEKTIKIFKSAALDHEPVEGRSYYLVSPAAPLFYHDSFKRCFIAEALGGYAGGLNHNASKDAELILDALRKPSCAGYLQIFAWEALGRLSLRRLRFFEERRKDLLEAFSGTTASLLGALLFLDKACLVSQKEKALSLIHEGSAGVRYKVQKALLNYFLMKNALPVQLHPADKDIREYLEKCEGRELISRSGFEEGAREIGLIPGSQKGGLQAGTQQAEIGYRLKKMCGDYVSAIGFYLKAYWE